MKLSLPPKQSLLPAALLLASALTGCFSSGTSGDDSDMSLSTVVGSYTLTGDHFILPARTDTNFYCNGDVPQMQTAQSGPDTIRFTISGSTLTTYYVAESMDLSDAVLEDVAIFTRIGTGSGLEGTWRLTDQGYRVTSGTLTADEKAQRDFDLAEAKHFAGFSESTLKFSAGTITNRYDLSSAAQFIDNWNVGEEESDSARYDISVRVLDKHTVELKGKKTGETVHLEISPLFDMTYTSSVPGHAEHHFLPRARTCPIQFEPAWYPDFKSDNLKEGQIPEQSTGKILSKRAFSHDLGLFPLKAWHSFLN